MVVVLVHWLIKKGKEEEFKKHWYSMTIDDNSGLYREILTEPDKNIHDTKFQTFSLENPNYTTFINIGIWKSLDDFDKAIGKYIPNVKITKKKGKTIQQIELDDFEFKLRERIVLKTIKSRGGSLPKADLKN